MPFASSAHLQVKIAQQGGDVLSDREAKYGATHSPVRGARSGGRRRFRCTTNMRESSHLVPLPWSHIIPSTQKRISARPTSYVILSATIQFVVMYSCDLLAHVLVLHQNMLCRLMVYEVPDEPEIRNVVSADHESLLWSSHVRVQFPQKNGLLNCKARCNVLRLGDHCYLLLGPP